VKIKNKNECSYIFSHLLTCRCCKRGAGRMKIVYCDDLESGVTICVGELIIKSAKDQYKSEQEEEV